MASDVRVMFTGDEGRQRPADGGECRALPTPSLALPEDSEPFSRLSVRARKRAQIRRVHGLSAPAKAARRLRAELVAHVGGNPTPVQMALIETACQLRLKLAVFDARFIELGGLSDHGRREYLAFVNSFCRVLDRLGFASAPEPRPSIADHLAGAP
jgi:hypothetical protein